jgi:hypothetical protein
VIEERVMKAALLLIIAVGMSGTANGQEYFFGERYIPTGPNGYIYDRTWGHTSRPYYGYGYRPRYSAYGYAAPYSRAYRPLAPYGFGNRNYTGYNDPYYYSYGPGVREFLDFGGADFYGW